VVAEYKALEMWLRLQKRDDEYLRMYAKRVIVVSVKLTAGLLKANILSFNTIRGPLLFP
jgi:hypothetical protein